MRDDESCTSSVEDESVDRSMSALRLGFKALYEEIDMLSEQATRTVQAIVKESADESVQLKKEDIDDLITYARKFIRETRKTIVTFDEHGVQCEPERRSSKKVSTPKAWKKPIVVERAAAREDITEVAHRRRSAVTVIQSFPRDDGPCVFCDEREPEQERVSASPAAVRIPAQPLNNTVAVETMPEKAVE
uniref:Uncharacterized protein n=1 Tax=Anopheles epiroticus TaxID=199890 RepID=A0A182PI50_9DIPT